MTVRTNAVQTCDRCLKPFNEKHLKVGDEVPVFKQKGLVVSSTTGTNKEPEPKSTVVLSFDDMCPDCQNAVDNLIAKIRLDGTKPKVAKKRRSKKKDKPAPPPVKEYSEDKGEAKTEESAEEPTEKPGPDGEPATPSEEPQESQEAKAETTEAPAEENSEPEAEAAPETTEEPPAEAEATDDSGNGAEAGSDDDNLMTDPATGDVYDKTTGEVVSKGNSGESEKHPF